MRKSLLVLAVGAILATSASIPAPASAETIITTAPERVVVVRKKPRKTVVYDQYGNRHVAIVKKAPPRKVVVVREPRPREVLVVR